MTKNFIILLKAIAPLEDEVANFITHKLLIHHLPKNSFILPLGSVSDRLYFLSKGLARAFYVANNKEITAWLVIENDFIYSSRSLLTQTPTTEAIELLEDSTLISLSYEDLNKIYETYPETNKIGRIITEKYLLIYEERNQLLQIPSAKEKFKLFSENHSDFYYRVPLKHIASYLGVTPETISRIQNKKYG